MRPFRDLLSISDPEMAEVRRDGLNLVDSAFKVTGDRIQEAFEVQQQLSASGRERHLNKRQQNRLKTDACHQEDRRVTETPEKNEATLAKEIQELPWRSEFVLGRRAVSDDPLDIDC